MSCFDTWDIGACGCGGAPCVATSTSTCGTYPLSGAVTFVDSNGSGTLSTTCPAVFSGRLCSSVRTASGPVNTGACVSGTQNFNYYWALACHSDGTITTSIAYRLLLACCGPGNSPINGPVLYAPVGSSNAYTVYQTQTVIPSISGGNIVIPWTLPLWTNPNPTYCTMPAPPASTVTFTMPLGITCVNCSTCGSSGIQNPLYVTDANYTNVMATWNGSAWWTPSLCAVSTSPVANCSGGAVACHTGSQAGTPAYGYAITCVSSGVMKINRYHFEQSCSSPTWQYGSCSCAAVGGGTSTSYFTTSGNISVTCGAIAWTGTLGSNTGNLADPVGGTVSFTQ